MVEYRYPICDCDVRDRERLEQYRRKRNEWIDLFEKDENSVCSQLQAMLWHQAVFHVVNESRRLAHASGKRSASLNGMLNEFLDHGFVAIQALSIRKLLEQGATKPHRQIVSLRRLLDDVRQNRSLITREIYVCHDGLPYDSESAEARHMADVARTIAEQGSGPVFSPMPAAGPEGFHVSKRLHEEFDQLAGTNPSSRTRTDLIREGVFDRLDKKLDACRHKEFKLYADKLIAHAGDAYSRTLADEINFSLERLRACHKTIYEVADFVACSLINGTAVGGFPIPQFDQLEHLDASWCSESQVEELRSHWDAYVSEVDSWRAFRVKELLAAG